MGDSDTDFLGWARIWSAVRRDDVGEVARALRQGTSRLVEIRDSDDSTLLLVAATRGSARVALTLLEAGADPSACNASGDTVLVSSARSRKIGLLRAILQAGACVDVPDGLGRTALMVASLVGWEGGVVLLLEHGARVNARDPRRGTALMYASQSGHPAIVSRLMGAGASVGAISTGGSTAMAVAANRGHVDVAMRLLRAGASVDPPTIDCWPPIIAAVDGESPSAVAWLLSHGASPAARWHGCDALHWAVLKGLDGLVTLLVESSVDLESRVNGGDLDGCTPLLLACATGHLNVARLLFQAGASLDATDSQHNSAYVHAAAHNHLELLQWLMEEAG